MGVTAPTMRPEGGEARGVEGGAGGEAPRDGEHTEFIPGFSPFASLLDDETEGGVLVTPPPENTFSDNLGTSSGGGVAPSESDSDAVEVLGRGVDSLYVGWWCRLAESDLETFEKAKTRATVEGASEKPVELEVAGITFKVLDHGAKPWSYIMLNDDVIVCVAGKKSDSFPAIYIHFRSAFLWRLGYRVAFKVYDDWVRSFCAPVKEDGKIESLLSRVDIAVDFLGWRPKSGMLENFATRAVQRATFHEGRKFTGFRFGKSKIVCRIYDKTEEIKNSSKRWFYDVWGRSEEQVVKAGGAWRVEFQIRREAIKEMQAIDKKTGEVFGHRFDDMKSRGLPVEACFDALGDVWNYLALSWCSLREPSADPNRSRWPVNSAWRRLAVTMQDEGDWEAGRFDLVRFQEKDLNIDNLVPGLVGYLSTIGSLGKVLGQKYDTPETVLAWLGPRVKRYFKRRGTGFEYLTDLKSALQETAEEERVVWGRESG